MISTSAFSHSTGSTFKQQVQGLFYIMILLSCHYIAQHLVYGQEQQQFGLRWIQRGTDIDGEAAGDYSGVSVSVSADGSVVAIGAPYNDGNGTRAGHVRVYEWNVTASDWSQRGTDIDGEAAD
jgi:hypothetical protein